MVTARHCFFPPYFSDVAAWYKEKRFNSAYIPNLYDNFSESSQWYLMSRCNFFLLTACVKTHRKKTVFYLWTPSPFLTSLSTWGTRYWKLSRWALCLSLSACVNTVYWGFFLHFVFKIPDLVHKYSAAPITGRNCHPMALQTSQNPQYNSFKFCIDHKAHRRL